ncbi:allantoicase, expressed, purine use [Aspergillus japonicus CBS 114.51]|uniref:allantoicase n=1 Tax=Aspergillus japonicus CBS 114.51 TaxID=1448312 RepID=A0A8T8XAR5_ASPJA|nr:allantoicase, expressed, purine use [Aspergillus japonicus CBS 114.51]RAH85286.1 allantoicase, expressed, purine use [Aspergillus japonicus CBS 114.51]
MATTTTTTTEYPYIPGADIDRTFAHTTNLASSALNTRILACSNEYFAAASNLLTPTAPINRPGVFIHTGAWYDGWETRRHNPAPYDWVVIKLGPARAAIQGVEVDTGFFVGNYGERAEVQATCSDADDATLADPNYAGWSTILPPQPCGPAQRRAWLVPGYDPKRPTPYTHVRLLMYPDGGFGRLRLYGHAIPAAAAHAEEAEEEEEEELSSALCGGLALAASDQHYTPCSNLLLPGRGKDMGDGWETARSRAPGHVDWAIVQLGLAGSVSKVVVDTKDFRGNFPRAVRVHGLVQGEVGEAGSVAVPAHDHPGWVEIVKGDQRCQADTEHVFQGADLAPGVDAQAFSHVKLTLVPDGGVKRFRVFGRRA